MGNLLFSPSGRITPAEFMKGATLLIIIGLVLALIPAFIPALGMLAILGLVMIWCWIVLWIKRYHDGGKSGWMSFIPIIAYLVIGMIVGLIVASMFKDPAYAAAIEAATESGDFGAMMKSMQGGGLTKMGTIINGLAAAAVAYVIAMVFNNMIKRDDHDNQFGPAS